MRQLGWLASACVLFAAVVAVDGWPALRELDSSREWRAIDAAPNGASLEGLQVAVETQVAAIAAQRPERAAVLIRLSMEVTPAAREAWKDCRVSLHDTAGKVWMPLTSANSDGAIKALSPDRKSFGPCRLYSTDERENKETILADQLFLLPADSLQTLRLHVSGVGTRPRALSFAIAPAVRQLP
ncbi:MAG: hypothetical protein WBF88_04605 [Pusillimonas sp.]